MSVSPLKPADVGAAKRQALPDPVIQVWNDLIATRFSGGSAHVFQEDAVSSLMAAMECSSAHVFANHWLDIEAMYEAEGWTVEYDKPGYNESYPASFTFTR